MMTEPTTVLVVSFDRWPWPALGCYGHEWIDTPAWDQLAAEGFVFDRCVATIDQGRRARAELWNDFLPRSRFAGHQSTLFREASSSPLGPESLWGKSHIITGNPDPNSPLAEQPFAKLIQAAMVELRVETSVSRLLWVHGVGLPERCPVSRAALELYSADFAEEGLRLASMTDEELVDHELTRATTLSVLDHWLGELLDAVRVMPGRNLMTVFAWAGAIWEPAARPTPLIAPFDPQVAQVPWIIAGDGILPGRTNALVTTDDLFPTLGGWVGVSDNPKNRASSGTAKSLSPPLVGLDLGALMTGDQSSVRDSVVCCREREGAIWTTKEFMCFAQEEDVWKAQRFFWPDDGWAVYDIADQTQSLTDSRIRHMQALSSKGAVWSDSLDLYWDRPHGRPRL